MENINITKISVFAIFILLFSLFSAIAFAQEDLALPAFFYGKAQVNGRDVPVGSIVLAKIDNSERGSIEVTVAGEYGSADTYKKLHVTGSSSDSGKEIEFFVKLPGMQEIKANETFPWESQSTNYFDLNFIGSEVPVPTPSPDDSSGGGGGGGSGGGGGGGPSQTDSSSASYYYDIIKANEQNDIVLTSSDIPITRLQLILNTDLQGINFEIKVVDEPEAPKLNGVYKYISISAPKITEDKVKVAIIRFQIPNTWFEENNYDPAKVKLLRYNDNQWNELEIFHEDPDAKNNYYRAATPGFSYFAIISEKLVMTAPSQETEKTETLEEETEEETEGEPALTALPIKPHEDSNPAMGIAIIVIIVILGAAFAFYYKNKIKKWG